MERSKFLSLNTRDFLKGAGLAVFAAVIAYLYNAIELGDFAFNVAMLWAVLKAGGLALLAYITKNLFENSAGQLGTEK